MSMMPPKGVSKAVSKRCPECRIMIPVATRHCHCGHQFFEERRRSTTSNPSEHDDGGGEDGTSTNASPPPSAEPGAAQSSNLPSPLVEGKRRSERVKREKPNFYDSLEYDNQMRKARKERQKEDQSQTYCTNRIKRERKLKNSSEPDDDDEDDHMKEKRRKKKKKKNSISEKKEVEVEIDEDIMTGISEEKEWQYSVVLSDINLKLNQFPNLLDSEYHLRNPDSYCVPPDSF